MTHGARFHPRSIPCSLKVLRVSWTGADPGFFQRGGCKSESSRQTSQPWGRGRVGRIRVLFEYVDFFSFDFRGISRHY